MGSTGSGVPARPPGQGMASALLGVWPGHWPGHTGAARGRSASSVQTPRPGLGCALTVRGATCLLATASPRTWQPEASWSGATWLEGTPVPYEGPSPSNGGPLWWISQSPSPQPFQDSHCAVPRPKMGPNYPQQPPKGVLPPWPGTAHCGRALPPSTPTMRPPTT